jgi:hypothetical protein
VFEVYVCNLALLVMEHRLEYCQVAVNADSIARDVSFTYVGKDENNTSHESTSFFYK